TPRVAGRLMRRVRDFAQVAGQDIVTRAIADDALNRLEVDALGLDVQINTGFAKVSVVGAGMHGVPGVMARVVNCLTAENIPIYQTSDSHANISCLVLEEHTPRAVQALYREFHLDSI
ncbi:MAG TPA: ACT domain-containing protein, partial [Limnochordia bacterium]|nr:ACT domain-containing protein [Limnochordia bacterium]